MQFAPFLLVVQGTQAIAAAEQNWRATERVLGIPLACYVIPEHDIVLCVSDRPGPGAASPAYPQRCVLPRNQGLPADNRRFVFSLRQPGYTQPGLHGVDLVGAGSTLIAKSISGPPRAAQGPTVPYDLTSFDNCDFLIEFDPANEAWMIARGDPGLQTLYYKINRDRTTRFAASTQFRALLPFFERRPALDHIAVSRFLCNGFFCEPETPIAGIRSMLPNEMLRADSLGETWRPDGDSRFGQSKSSVVSRSPMGESHQRVRQQLVQVIETQTAHSSDTACLLSGGVDSSTVAAIAATLLGKTVHTYTLVFEDAAINEAEYASAVARRIGSNHREILLKQEDFEGSLDWLLGSLDMPTTDGLNSLLITRAIGQAGHPAALVGVGSDELFGGHECMQRVPRALALLRLFNRLPASARRVSRATLAALTGCARDPWLPSRGLRGKFLTLLEGEADPLGVYLLSRRVLLPAAVARLRPGTGLDSYASLPSRVLERIPSALSTQPLSKQVSYFEQLVYLRNQLLRDLQMVGVATGVGIRAPFVDPQLVSLVASLPASEVFGGPRPKQFLIDCVSDVLPREAYQRPKLGFVLPIGQWLGGLVTSRVQQLSSRTDLLEYLDLDLAAVETILDDCAAARGRVFYTREWCLFVLLDWCSRYL